MPVLSNKNLLHIAISLLLINIGCKKEIEEQQVYDNVIYEIDSTKLYGSSAQKTKQKTPTQYISILYSDLFSNTIPINDLTELSVLSLALGDKSMVNELILSNALSSPSIVIPSDSQMRNDIESFVTSTYRKFYQRNPTPYEQLYMVDLINKDTDLKVIEIYTSFILSNEYYYY